MTNNKQSSVDILFEDLFNSFEKFNNGKFCLSEYISHNLKVLEQAKAMHQQEHSNTWDDSVDNYKKRGENDMRHWVDFDEYYNETYK